MMSSEILKAFLTQAKESGAFDAEGAKLDFAIGLAQLLEETETSKAELARRLKVSQPMVSKILRGDSNVTIETMARAVHAAKGKLSITIKAVTAAKHAFNASRYLEYGRTAFEDTHANWMSFIAHPSIPYDMTLGSEAANDNEIEPIAA